VDVFKLRGPSDRNSTAASGAASAVRPGLGACGPGHRVGAEWPAARGRLAGGGPGRGSPNGGRADEIAPRVDCGPGPRRSSTRAIAWMQQQIARGDVPAAADRPWPTRFGSPGRLAILMPDDGRPALGACGSPARSIGALPHGRGHRLVRGGDRAWPGQRQSPTPGTTCLVAAATLVGGPVRGRPMRHRRRAVLDRVGLVRAGLRAARFRRDRAVGGRGGADRPDARQRSLRRRRPRRPASTTAAVLRPVERPDANPGTAGDLLAATMPPLSASDEMLVTTLLTAVLHLLAWTPSSGVAVGEYLGGYTTWRGGRRRPTTPMRSPMTRSRRRRIPCTRRSAVPDRKAGRHARRYGEAHRAYRECCGCGGPCCRRTITTCC